MCRTRELADGSRGGIWVHLNGVTARPSVAAGQTAGPPSGTGGPSLTYRDEPSPLFVWSVVGTVSVALACLSVYAHLWGQHGKVWRNSDLAGIGIVVVIALVRRFLKLGRAQIVYGGLLVLFNFAGGTVGWYELSMDRWFGLPIAFDNLTHALFGFLYGWTAYRLAMFYRAPARRGQVPEGCAFDTFGPRACTALAILASQAVGAIWEMIEFGGVALFGLDTIGGYTNNSLDLYFNLLGAALSTLIMTSYHARARGPCAPPPLGARRR